MSQREAVLGVGHTRWLARRLIKALGRRRAVEVILEEANELEVIR